MARSPLHQLEKDAEDKAREYKRQLVEEGMKKLAAQEAARTFPPQGDALPPYPDAPPDADVDGGAGDR